MYEMISIIRFFRTRKALMLSQIEALELELFGKTDFLDRENSGEHSLKWQNFKLNSKSAEYAAFELL